MPTATKAAPRPAPPPVAPIPAEPEPSVAPAAAIPSIPMPPLPDGCQLHHELDLMPHATGIAQTVEAFITGAGGFSVSSGPLLIGEQPILSAVDLTASIACRRAVAALANGPTSPDPVPAAAANPPGQLQQQAPPPVVVVDQSKAMELVAIIGRLPDAHRQWIADSFRQQFAIPGEAPVSTAIKTAEHTAFIEQLLAQLPPEVFPSDLPPMQAAA